MNFTRTSLSLLASFTLATGAFAQDLNVKFGLSTPPPTYGAASGNVGFWNTIEWERPGCPSTSS